MQITLMLGVLIGGIFISIKGFAGKVFGGKDANEPKHQLVLEGASIADMSLLREMVAALTRIAVATERGADVQRDRLDAEQRKLEIQAAIEEDRRRDRRRNNPTP